MKNLSKRQIAFWNLYDELLHAAIIEAREGDIEAAALAVHLFNMRRLAIGIKTIL